jgi:hypothetical protein
MMRSRFRSILLVSALALAPAQAWAQASDAERIAELERLLASQQEALGQLKAQIEALKPKPVQTNDVAVRTSPIKDTEAICTMRGDADLTNALWGRIGPEREEGGAQFLPNLNDCELSPAESSRGLQHVAADPNAPSSTRPVIATGFASSLQFGKDSRASLTYAHPIIWRLVNPRQFDGFTPQQGSVSLSLSTPLDNKSGLGNLLDGRERERFRDLNILSGTSVKLGFDFMQFSRRDRARARKDVLAALYTAFTACLEKKKPAGTYSEADFEGYFSGSVPNQSRNLPEGCTGENLIEFITETKPNSAVLDGHVLVRPELATAYQQAFWTAPKIEVPTSGWGVSAEISFPDFSFRQAAYTPGLVNGLAGNGTSADKYRISFDYTQPIPPDSLASSVGKLDFAFNAYVMRYFEFDAEQDGLTPTPPKRNDVPGVQSLLSIRHSREWAFRPGTADQTICPAAAPPAPVAGQTNVSSGCALVNLDAPFARKSTILSLELRSQVDNIPFVGKFGMAPKIGYRLQDDRIQLDLPLYFTVDKEGKLAAGVRVTHQTGGRNLIGNPEETNTSVSIFFNALSFRPF